MGAMLASPLWDSHLVSELNFGLIFAQIWPLQASKHPVWGRRNARSVPPPTEGGAGRAGPELQLLDQCFILAISKHIPNIVYILRLLPPPFFSPQEVAHSAGPTQKSSYVLLLGVFSLFFGLPKRCSKNASKKHRKNCEHRGFWSPKTLPKPSQNGSKNVFPKNM